MRLLSAAAGVSIIWVGWAVSTFQGYGRGSQVPGPFDNLPIVRFMNAAAPPITLVLTPIVLFLWFLAWREWRKHVRIQQRLEYLKALPTDAIAGQFEGRVLRELVNLVSMGTSRRARGASEADVATGLEKHGSHGRSSEQRVHDAATVLERLGLAKFQRLALVGPNRIYPSAEGTGSVRRWGMAKDDELQLAVWSELDRIRRPTRAPRSAQLNTEALCRRFGVTIDDFASNIDQLRERELISIDGLEQPVTPSTTLRITDLGSKELTRMKKNTRSQGNQAGPTIIFEGPVGTANWGTIDSINNSIGTLVDAGNDALSEGMREMTQAVLDSDLDDGSRNDVLEHLALLGDEANKDPSDRRRAPARSALSAIGQVLTDANLVATNANSLMETWHQRVEPMIRQALTLGQGN